MPTKSTTTIVNILEEAKKLFVSKESLYVAMMLAYLNHLADYVFYLFFNGIKATEV